MTWTNDVEYLLLDFETWSPVDLREKGVHNYMRHPKTRALCAAFAVITPATKAPIAARSTPLAFPETELGELDERNAAEALAHSLKGKVITLRAKCGDKGRLYGSVTVQEIAQALKEQHGVEIDKRKIEVAEAVRTVGEYEAQITVYAGVKAQMKLSVLAAQ